MMADSATLSSPSGVAVITHPKTSRGAFGSLLEVDGRLGMDVLRAAGQVTIDFVAGEFDLNPSSGAVYGG